jgi:hypothetical protein
LCNTLLHFDGDFAYAIRCWNCERVWELPAYVPITLRDEGECHVIQDAFPHGDADRERAGKGRFEVYDPNVLWP